VVDISKILDIAWNITVIICIMLQAYKIGKLEDKIK